MGRPRLPIDHGTSRGARAHYRRGERPCPACYQAMLTSQGTRGGYNGGANSPDRRERRNGLPEFRPYVYRGLGFDALTGDADT